MHTRNMAAAFLTCNNKLLLMHRDMNRTLAPGMWAAVGGHMEPEELSDPEAACLREVREETGITPEAIRDLRLRYVVLRRVDDEIRVTYYYFGELTREVPLAETSEGTLHWIDADKLPELPMTFSVRCILDHWLRSRDSDCVTVCAVNAANDQVTWSVL
jgi:8-oxo-dGTP diphosphatase